MFNKTAIVLFFIGLSILAFAQQQTVLSNSVFVKISNNAQVGLDNPSIFKPSLVLLSISKSHT